MKTQTDKKLAAFREMVENLDILSTADIEKIAKEDDTICFVCWDELWIKAQEIDDMRAE